SSFESVIMTLLSSLSSEENVWSLLNLGIEVWLVVSLDCCKVEDL
ncbi:7840_t:CDS:1, partial [Racocetra fulgida]